MFHPSSAGKQAKEGGYEIWCVCDSIIGAELGELPWFGVFRKDDVWQPWSQSGLDATGR